MPSKYVFKPKTKMMACRHCGEPVEVGWKTKRLPCCGDCSADASAKNNLELHNHSGPGYDRWLAAMKAWSSREITGTPPSP